MEEGVCSEMPRYLYAFSRLYGFTSAFMSVCGLMTRPASLCVIASGKATFDGKVACTAFQSMPRSFWA